MAKRIGGDWVENVDPASGRKYYANLVTKVTTWSYPEELKTTQAAETHVEPAAAVASVNLSEWAEKMDPRTSRMYYFNRATKETTWTKPNGWDEYKATQGDSTSTTQAAQTAQPTQAATVASSAAATSTAAATTAAAATNSASNATTAATGGAVADSDNASFWKSRVDPNSGRTYYFNTATRVTQWAKPACMEGADAGTASQPQATATASAASDKQTASSSSQNEAAEQSTNTGGAMHDSSSNSSMATNNNSMPTATTQSSSAQSSVSLPTRRRAGEPSGARENVKMDESKIVSEEEINYTDRDPDEIPTAELVKQVEGVTMEQYAERYFNFERKGLWKSRTTMEKILSWKSELIKTSLRTLNSDLGNEAVQAFRNITGYMGDRGSNKSPMDHAQKLLNNMLLAPEELRDEIYCQIVKQTNNNPSTESTIKGWQLMLIALAAFPPSEELRPHLMSYCVANLNSAQVGIPKMSDIALHKIPKITRLGPRREIPTRLEMEALRDGNAVVTRVDFLDHKYTMLKVDSWTTATDFEKLIAKKLGIKSAKPFSVYEVSSSDEERVLDGDERVLDLVAYWQRMEAEERTKKGKQEEIEEFRFMYKVRLFFDVEDADTSAVEVTYIQAKHDVVDARYPCSEQDAVTLAALQVQEEFSDHPGEGRECTYIRGNIGKYLAKRYYDSGRDSEMEEQIMKLYCKLSGYSQMEARLSYLDYVKSWKIYGSAYFFAEPQNNREFPTEVVLAVNNKGILVVDPESKDFLAEYPYQNVVTWGHSQNSFVVVTGNASRQTRVFFKTDQGKEINAMVRSYVEYIMQ